jgi:2-oxoglutarate dehydrogenase E2 component (dihydrolipoamide succinyltransferase)
MAMIELVVPRLGESVIEVTITKWLKNEGDLIDTEEALAEIATDKVDSEIVSTARGKLVKKLYKEGDVVAVGKPFAVVESKAAVSSGPGIPPADSPLHAEKPGAESVSIKEPCGITETHDDHVEEIPSSSRYYSPLVRSIAQQEGLSIKELDSIPGTGKEDRLTKQDILDYINRRKSGENHAALSLSSAVRPEPVHLLFETGEDRIVEMDRVRQLIAGHMIRSVQTSAHVTSFIEADMSRIVEWREQHKDSFLKKYREKLTFTPIFIEAIVKAIRDYPMVNVSVDGTKIIVHSKVNVGMAVALPSNNLIVPVLSNCGNLNLLGIIKAVNDLANRARKNKLVPDEIAGGTISLTNLGSFGTIMGTPIINQPQTAIIAAGAIKKRVVVIESPQGDMIAIRPVMICSITFDHRVIDGSLGGQFLNRLAQYLEQFDNTQTI